MPVFPLLLAVMVFAPAFLLSPFQATAQDAAASSFQAAGVSWLPAVPLGITAGVDAGYDDNVTLTPDAQGSFFSRENIVLTYSAASTRTQFYLLGVGRFTQFFDLTGEDDTSGNITLGFTHNFSTRLFLYASAYASYQKEPNFNSDIGPENVRAAHFDTNDNIALTYYWLPRLSSITSYTFSRVDYEGSIGNSQDRSDNTIGERFQFSLTTRTNVSCEYRYEIVNYDTAPLDSTTHYLLFGVDHHLTEHLVIRADGGESIRSLQNQGISSSPYFAGSLDYVSSNHRFSWVTRYGFEAPNAEDVSIRQTWRTGLLLTYDLSSRLSSTFAVFYNHDENQGGTSDGPQDAIDMTVGLRYVIRRGLIFHVDYTHSSETSLASMPAYSRNSYSAGLSYTY
ncbi:MAG TPA: outer membrane beta-barrel protein [Terriglobales bacterium]